MPTWLFFWFKNFQIHYFFLNGGGLVVVVCVAGIFQKCGISWHQLIWCKRRPWMFRSGTLNCGLCTFQFVNHINFIFSFEIMLHLIVYQFLILCSSLE